MFRLVRCRELTACVQVDMQKRKLAAQQAQLALQHRAAKEAEAQAAQVSRIQGSGCRI